MSVLNVNVPIQMLPTRWDPPLPSHRWFGVSIATVGDGSGGIQPLTYNLLTDAPLNIPPCSVEDLTAWSDDAAHPFIIAIRYGGGLIDSLLTVASTYSTLTSGYYYSSAQNMPQFAGQHMIRPRMMPTPLTTSVLMVLSATNINTKNFFGSAWGYLWQIPEKSEPWHPTWGPPPK
jgi:hypothetical protein